MNPQPDRLGTLTDSQLRSLLQLAAEVPSELPSDHRIARIQQSLDEVGRLKGVQTTNLLNRAIDPQTSVKALRDLKDLAKALILGSNTAPQREAATLLYHVAVVAALEHHGASISSGSLEQRRDLYRELAATLEDHAIGNLFRRAADRTGDDHP
jgi:hypothetical protein